MLGGHQRPLPLSRVNLTIELGRSLSTSLTETFDFIVVVDLEAYTYDD